MLPPKNEEPKTDLTPRQPATEMLRNYLRTQWKGESERIFVSQAREAAVSARYRDTAERCNTGMQPLGVPEVFWDSS